MTKNIVPRGDLEGQLGTGEKRWAKAYISNVSVTYDTVADMKADLELREGSTAVTKAKSTKNDGMGGLYIIREKTMRDYFNNGLYLDDYINIELDNGLVAEKIVSESIPAVSNIHNSDGIVQRLLEICETYNA